MATFIRIDRAGWRGAWLLGAIALVPLAAGASEAEIHVSIGADGIEIFSNLPRGPFAGSGAPQRPVTGQTTIALVQPLPAPDETSRMEGDATAPGKSFLLDD